MLRLRRILQAVRLLAAVPVAVVLGCSGDDGPTDQGTNGSTVSVNNNNFSPPSLSVAVNTTVTWQWNSGGVAHNVTFQDVAPSATQGSGSFQRIFTAAGTYPYVCTIHAAQGMSGTVTVTAASGGGGGGGGGSGGGGGVYP